MSEMDENLEKLRKAQEEDEQSLEKVFQELQNPDVEKLAGYVASLLFSSTRDAADILRLKGILIALVKNLIKQGVLNEVEFDKECQEEIEAVSLQQLEEMQELSAELEKETDEEEQ